MKQYSFLNEFIIQNRSGSIMLYHISPVKLKNNILVPRIPTSIDTGHSENNKDARICFARSINGCISAVPYGGNTLKNIRRIWYVYVPIDINTKYLYEPTEKEVPDVKVTGEIWYTKKCHLKYIGMIFITEANSTKKIYKTHKKYEYVKNQYEPPYFIYELKEKGYDLKKLCGKKWWTLKENDSNDTSGQIAHKWRAITGIELIHKEPTIEELNRIWKNWNLMTDNMKKVSDKKSLELFSLTNKKHFEQLLKQTDSFD